jgi:hypothetical protein
MKPTPKRSRTRHSGFRAGTDGQVLMGRALCEYLFGTLPTDRDYELARRRLYRQPKHFGLFKVGNLWGARKETLDRAVARLESGEGAEAETSISEVALAPEIVRAVVERITRAVFAELAGKQFTRPVETATGKAA